MKPVSWGIAYAILTGMKSWGPASFAAGYTVIEVIIVLGVSTALLLSAILFFSGKSAETELNQSVRDMESKVQSIIGEVQNGYFPNNSINCAGDDVGSPVTITPPAPGTPGYNVNCVFLGKAIGFTNTGKMNIISVVGRQFVGAINSNATSSLTEALPQGVKASPDSYTYGFGLEPDAIYDNSNPTTAAPAYGAIAFLAELGGAVGSGNPLAGSRSTLIYGISTSTLADNSDTVADKIDIGPPLTTLIPLPQGARICLTGGNGKRAEITIGGNGDQLNTNVLINTGVGSEC